MLSVATHRPFSTSLKRGCLGAAVAVVVIFTPSARSEDSEPGPVVRIEEDWKLVLNEPCDTVTSPQFHTTMAPFPHLDSFYAQVTWNYRETPDFTAGGLQLHSWDGEEEIRRRGVRSTPLSVTAETITWTQTLETDGATLLFEIINGQSTTWGEFGRDMQIATQASLQDLAGYTTDLSVANSCITYGTNRVNMLMITEVRHYDADGVLVLADSTPRYVYVLEEEEEGEGDAAE